MMTAQDFPSACVADEAGMDIVLVGDSLAMVALGMDNTAEVGIEDMLLHCKSVSRGARSSFLVSADTVYFVIMLARNCSSPLFSPIICRSRL